MEVILNPPMLAHGVVEHLHLGGKATEIVVTLALRARGCTPYPLDHHYGGHIRAPLLAPSSVVHRAPCELP